MSRAGRQDGPSLEIDNERFARAIGAFLRSHIPDVASASVRTIAFDVVVETQKALNGQRGGLPKRIDTGRLRGGWRVALENGGLPTAGLARSSANTSADGDATDEGRGHERTITVTNKVEYAPFVEFGTAHMAPGLHLTRALRVTAQRIIRRTSPENVSGELRTEVDRAWTAG